MRATVALFFIGLFAMSMAYNADINFLKTLKRQQFGKTLLETIQVQMSGMNEDPATVQSKVDQIVALLNLMRTQTVDAQKKDAVDNKVFQAQKKATMAKLTLRIAQLTKAIQEDKHQIILHIASIASTKLLLREEQKRLAVEQDLLVKNVAAQKRAKIQYEKEFLALSNQVFALAQAKQQILHLKAGNTLGNSFVQLQSSIKNIEFKHPKYQSMINVLAQMMTADIISNQKLVQNILDIIDKLSAEIRQEMKLLTQSYELHMGDLRLQEARYVTNIHECEARIAGCETKIAQLNLDITTRKQNIANNSQRKSESEAEYQDNARQAADRQKQFVINTARRNDEIAIIDKVIEIMTTRFSKDVRALIVTL